MKRLFLCVTLIMASRAAGADPVGAMAAAEPAPAAPLRQTSVGAANEQQRMVLSGSDWWIHEDDSERSNVTLATAATDQPGWTPATVPGNVQSDLEAAHQLKPLFYGAGDPRVDKVATKNWWYRKDFVVPQDWAEHRLGIVFEGVDCECEVWLNGRWLGAHSGMYRRFCFDLADAVQAGQTNRLAVKIHREPIPSAGLSWPQWPTAFRRHLKDLKCPGNAPGIDWSFGVFTLGIWSDVHLVATGPARIDWTRVRTSLSDNFSKATVRATLEVDSLVQVDARAGFRIVGHGATAARTTDVCLRKGHTTVDIELPLDRPALWWPSGQGEQPLYFLEARIEDAATGRLLDSRTLRFGVREIRWEQVPGAPATIRNPLKLVVNGRPIRQMGSNLVMPDIFPGRFPQHFPRLLELAKAAGMNTLRAQGAGTVLQDSLYDLADELGLMILQDFPMANCWPETDALFLANLEVTVRNIVRQLRNHPCIVEWSGGNEMRWNNETDHPALHVLQKSVQEEDDRIFRSTCGSDAKDGCGGHGPYLYSDSIYRRMNTLRPVRASEFGVTSVAHLETWQRDIPPASQWLINRSDAILSRKKLFIWINNEQTESLFGPAASLERLIRASQFIGAEGLRYYMDALRRNGTALPGGFMNWDFSEPWPVLAGHYMIDYDGRTLMNYDFVKQALAPVSLTLQYDSLVFDPAVGVKAQLFLTSDAPQAVGNFQWRWLARDCRGQVLGHGDGTASIAPQEVKPLATIALQPLRETAQGPVFVEMQLFDAARKLQTERLHVLGVAGVSAPLAGLLDNRRPDQDEAAGTKRGQPVRRTSLALSARPVRRDGVQEVLDLVVENKGPMTALFCAPHPLLEYRTDFFVDNNHCFIPPGECRTISIRASTKPAGGLTLAQTGWRLECWNADDVVIAPSEDVLLALGRRDKMCREFLGYDSPKKTTSNTEVTLAGRQPDPLALPFLQQTGVVVRLQFEMAASRAGRPARLRLHTADQAAAIAPLVAISINGRRMEQQLPTGLGIQATAPAQLAFPASAVFELAGGTLQAGTNTIEVRVTNDAWFTWDALDLVMNKP